MAIDLQKTLNNIRKQMGTYQPSTQNGDKINLSKTLDNVRALQKQQREQLEQNKLKLRKLQTSPLSARAAETLAGLQEGSEIPKLHPTGGPLQVSQDTLRKLGMVNENGFVFGGVNPTELGLDAEGMAKLGLPTSSVSASGAATFPAQAGKAGYDRSESRFKDYAGYLAGEFGAGVFSNPTGILAGAQTAVGDLFTGGQVSEGMQMLANYFAQKPQMLDRWMANERGVEQMIQAETGATGAQLAAYKTANTDDWLRQALQQDRGANLEQGFKDAAGNMAYTIGQQAPGMAYSYLAPMANAGSGGILGAMIDAAKAGGNVGQAARAATLNTLKGNISTWLLGAGAAGNQLTNLAQQRGSAADNYINATVNGFVEYFIEGALGISDADGLAEIWKNGGNGLGNALKSVGRYLATSVEEGLEEFINVPMSGIVDKLTTDKDKKLVGEGGIFDLKEMIKSGLQGMAVGMIMGGVGAVSSIRSAVLEGAEIYDAAEAMNHLIGTMPENIRPATIDPKSATAETLEAKQVEVLERLQEAAETSSTTGSAGGPPSPQAGKALEGNRQDAANRQDIDITQAVNQQGFEQAQNMPVQTNAQAVDVIKEQNQQANRGFAQEVMNNEQGQILSGDRSQRGSAAVDAGGADAVERTGTASAARRPQSAIAQERTDRARRAGLTSISARELGISTGTDLRRNVLLDDESQWDDELRQIRAHWDEMNQTRREKYGQNADLRLNFVLGKMQVADMDGNMTLVDGTVNDDGEVCIQVNGMQRSATQLADHEEYHLLESESPGLTRAVWQTVQSEGLNDALVEQYRRFYTETLGYSDEMVREEILADAYAGLERIQGTNMQSVRELVRQYTAEAKEAIDQGWYDPYAEEAYESVDTEGRETRGPPDARYSVTDEQALRSVGTELDEETESVNPARYSLSTWNESEYVEDRERAAEALAKAMGATKAEAEAYIDDVNSVAKMIADEKGRLDYESAPGLSAFVSNVEYGGSFDFSTLCKKRRLLTGTFSEIQKALPNTALTADEILEIRNMMSDAGLEVSCGLCYVEGSGANMGRFAKEFLRLYERDNPGKWVPNMAEMNTPDGIEWVRITHPEVYEQYEKFWNNYGRLQEDDPAIFASQQKPKLYQLRTEYKGEVLQNFRSDTNVSEKNKNGGVRMQSFSDFEIVHLLDTMQIIMDMSRVGLAGQAYTKVPDFAWAFGDTGLKINLSLIAKDVDENGQLIFDDKEGMPFEQAMELRERYSENVGTIIVTFTDEQLMAAMADDRIDFIIPFHRSQWKKNQYGAMGLPKNTKDYTYQQNEKLIKQTYHEYRGRMVKDKATNYMPNAYWDFSLSGKENAENYLRMCAENNKRPKFYKFLENNGDGSYSLKADGSTDGYWKLLIDFKMYDNEGIGSPQRPVRPDFNMEQARRMLDEYTGGRAQFPVAQGVVDEFVERYKERNPRAMYSVAEETAEPQRRDLTPGQELTRKEQSVIKRAINSSRMQLRDIIPAGTKEAREVQQMQILNLAQKLWENGEITQEDIDNAFEEIWQKGATVDREMADLYNDVRQALRGGVTVSEELKKDITDYEQFRRANFGLLTMRNGERHDVDVLYHDLGSEYPNLFPESITEPADQLQKMADVAQELKPVVKTMEQLHKGDWMAKAGFKADFVDLVKTMELEILHPVQEITQKTKNQQEAERVVSYRQIYKEVMEEVFKVQQRETYEPDPDYWHEVADDAWGRMNERAEAIQTEWLRSLTKEGFKGSENLDELGVKIAGSVADYHLIGQILENHRAAQAIRRDIRKAEKKLKATAKEKQFAAGIVSGTFSEADVGGDARLRVVLELADYYMLERTVGLDLIDARRNDMYAEVDYQVETLMRDKDAYKISSSPVLFYRTPQRNMIRMYGREQGQKIYDFLFAPVAENEAERIRWTNKMYDEVRLVEGENGKKKPLNRKERALVQMVMEGRAAAEVVAAMEERQVVYNAADNLRNGQAIEDVVREFNLNKELSEAATGYATWLDTNDILQTTKGVDLKRIENAVELYAKQYDRFYKAINDFLAAHGYEPIGFIKGYAPHIQPEGTRNLLQSTLKMMGLSEGVTTLPASIAGQTHTYRPNKRWNPYFMSRHGDATEYDVTAGYESYVDYLSDILYHTDDTVRIRRAANYFRRTYAPDEISNNLSWAEGLRNASPEQKAEMLREQGKLKYADAPSAEVTNELFDEYVSELYDNIKDQGKYSNFVNWLEDYANQLTGKQSLADRGMEVLTGRQSLNFANKLNRAFQRANVAGNLSTALNQTAQLPMIVADIGNVNTLLALKDYATGKVRRDGFREKSDFLTARKGMNNLVVDPADRIINIMFTPAQVADDMISTLAARGAYIKAVRQGMSDAEAMKYADRKAEQIMGSRAKGSAPQAFRRKNPFVRMVNMFQIEALNAFEYVEQDVIIQGIKDIKQIDDAKGRAKATAALIGLLGKMLVAAFLWNRVTEELYGGSPAQFDLLGYAANFLASGNGLTANQQLLDWIDLAWERAFGERLFDQDLDYNEEFDWANATDDLAYAVSSDVPLVRNIAGLLGLGDQSLPMPDLSTIYDAGKSLRDNGASLETLDAALTAAGQFLPGGRQINKTYQGARTMAKGGRYYGYGENERLQYPVDDTTTNWIKALLFGPTGLSENTEFYAAGGDDGLSAGNTRKYQEMMQVGMSSEMAMEVYEEYRRINRLETMTASEKATEFANTLYEMGVPEDQAALAREAFMFWSMVPGEANKYDSFVREGLDPSEAYELTQTLGELEPEDGETTVSSLQKYQAVIDMTDAEHIRLGALAGLMQDKELARFRAGYDYVDSGTYVAFLTAWQETYPGENKSQERVENVLRSMDLTSQERAALWQMSNAGWKPDNNPYNKTVGREVSAMIAAYYAEIDGE